MSHSTSKIYDGCRVMHPNGELMFRCKHKRANWYLDRGLAVKIKDHPFTVQLTFEPKGLGNIGDEFYLQSRDNLCVVCGSTEGLSRHHVVPHCYVRQMSQQFRHNSHDVLPMCVPCHELYEQTHSASLRQELADEYNAPINGNGEFVFPKPSVKAAYVLLKYQSQLPEYRQQELRHQICKELGRQPSDDDLQQLANMPKDMRKSDEFKTHGELVVSQITDLDAFVARWRSHFIETMKPKHLPRLWNVSRSVSRTRSET